MICAVHQPQTFPWLGYFAKIIQSDHFVILDNVQFKKNEWQNRNKIRTQNGWQWLTVPVLHHFGQLINEVKLNNTSNWRHKHLQALLTSYRKAPYFKQYFPELEELYHKNWQLLIDFNLTGIRWLLKVLNINTPITLASEMKEIPQIINLGAEERLIRITKALKADTYLSGAGGQEYLDQGLFPANQVKLIFQQFEHPVYHQLQSEFISHLSVLDLLFNEGPRSVQIIQGGMR